MSYLFNPESSIKLLKEDVSDYLMINVYNTSIPLYQFAKGYRINQLDNDINSGNSIRISRAKEICSKIKNRLYRIGTILKKYENKEINKVNPEIKRQFLDNYITSINCFNASKTWEHKYNTADRAYKRALENQKNKSYKLKNKGWTSIYN